MKKRVIIIFGFLLLIVVLILMFIGILPNIFLDRSNLICSRVYIENETMKQYDYAEFTFDNIAIVNGGVKKSEIIYYDKSFIQPSYEEFKKNEEYGNKVELKNDIIIISSPMEVTKKDRIKRKKIKQKYEEYGYVCE